MSKNSTGRYRGPSLNALRAFEAVVRHGRFISAAEELCITHSSVSRYVKLLEEDLGCPLLIRNSRGVTPTQDGTQLARAVEHALDHMTSAVNKIRGTTRNTLRVSCLGTFMLRRLIPALPDFAAVYPEIELALSQSDAPVDFVGGGYDIAIRVGARAVPGERYRKIFAEEKIGPVMAPSIAAQINPLDPASLSHVPRLHTATRRHAWAQWEEHTGLTIENRDQGPVFDHFYFMLNAVVSGLGAAVVPSILIKDDLEAHKLVAPFGFILSGQEYAVHIGNAAPEQSEKFAEWLIELTASD